MAGHSNLHANSPYFLFLSTKRDYSSVSSSVSLGIIRMSTVCSHFPPALLVMNTGGRLLLLLLSGLCRALSTGGYVRNEPCLSAPLFLPVPVLPDFTAKSLRRRLFTLCCAAACTCVRTNARACVEVHHPGLNSCIFFTFKRIPPDSHRI